MAPCPQLWASLFCTYRTESHRETRAWSQVRSPIAATANWQSDACDHWLGSGPWLRVTTLFWQCDFLFVLDSHLPPCLTSSLEKATLQGGTQLGFVAANDRAPSASSFTQEFPFTTFLGGSNVGVESLNQEPDRATTCGLQPLPHSEDPDSQPLPRRAQG